MKDPKKDREQREEEFEEEYFREDDKRGILIRGIIMLCLFLLLIAGVLIGILIAKKKKAPSTDLQESIMQNAEGEGETAPTEEPEGKPGEDEIFAREEDTREAPASPSPTPEIIGTPEPDAPVMEPYGKDYGKVKFDAKRNLSEMEGYFKDQNEEALWDLAHLDRYIAMSYSLKDSEQYIYYGDTNSAGEPEGTGIAVYADNEYYYGEWKNGLRNGAGTWVHYHIHLKENTKDLIYHHSFKGTFANDLPNGAGQDHYEYNTELLEAGKYYVTNYICSFKDGYIDGEIYATSITGGSGEYFDWIANAKEGSFEFISDSRDKNRRGPVMTDRENPDNYFWLSANENQKIGVKNYISENKH